jgi:2-dehydropantoate 2-reductase
MFNSTLIKLGSRIIKLNPIAKTSMWQSISRDRPTEIDYITGEIIALSNKNKIDAPINTKLVELVKNAEKEKPVKNYSPAELRNILGV